MRSLRVPLLVCAALATGGCYHAVVETGREPSGETIEREWAHSFIGGLVPPSVTETAEECPNGVARVETQHSFLNMVAQIVTGGIYSPMTITVQCADAGGDDNGAASRDAADETFIVRAGDDGAGQAMREAVRLSAETGRAVRVNLR